MPDSTDRPGEAYPVAAPCSMASPHPGPDAPRDQHGADCPLSATATLMQHEAAPDILTPKDLAELRRWLGDMQSLAEREGIYDGNASVRSIVVRVLPMLDHLANMRDARDNARAEVERLTGQIEAAKRIGLGTHLGRTWPGVLNDVLHALDGEVDQ